MKWVDLGRTATRYEQAGERGPLFVLVHEMGGSIEVWDGVVERLRGDYRLICYDVRGGGQAEKIGGPVTFDDLAQDLEALLQHLGIDEPFWLVGCAVGAGIAMTYAVRNPQRVAGLVLINPALGTPPESRQMRHERADFIATNGMRAAEPGSLDPGYPPEARGDREAYETFRARWFGTDPVSLAHLIRMVCDNGIEDRLEQIACPVLAISGQYDRVRSTDYIRKVAARIADVRIAVIPAGHHLPAQAPALLADLCRRFQAGEINEAESHYA